jgi:hypothetical protein
MIKVFIIILITILKRFSKIKGVPKFSMIEKIERWINNPEKI